MFTLFLYSTTPDGSQVQITSYASQIERNCYLNSWIKEFIYPESTWEDCANSVLALIQSINFHACFFHRDMDREKHYMILSRTMTFHLQNARLNSYQPDSDLQRIRDLWT